MLVVLDDVEDAGESLVVFGVAFGRALLLCLPHVGDEFHGLCEGFQPRGSSEFCVIGVLRDYRRTHGRQDEARNCIR